MTPRELKNQLERLIDENFLLRNSNNPVNGLLATLNEAFDCNSKIYFVDENSAQNLYNQIKDAVGRLRIGSSIQKEMNFISAKKSEIIKLLPNNNHEVDIGYHLSEDDELLDCSNIRKLTRSTSEATTDYEIQSIDSTFRSSLSNTSHENTNHDSSCLGMIFHFDEDDVSQYL